MTIQGINGKKDSYSVQLKKKKKGMQKCCDYMWSEQLNVPRVALSPHSLTNNPSAGAIFGPHSRA